MAIGQLRLGQVREGTDGGDRLGRGGLLLTFPITLPKEKDTTILLLLISQRCHHRQGMKGKGKGGKRQYLLSLFSFIQSVVHSLVEIHLIQATRFQQQTSDGSKCDETFTTNQQTRKVFGFSCKPHQIMASTRKERTESHLSKDATRCKCALIKNKIHI